MVLFSGGLLGKNPFRRPRLEVEQKTAFSVVISHFFSFLSSVVVRHDRAVGAGGGEGEGWGEHYLPPNFWQIS